MNLVNIGLSGLNANRVALDVTAQNVSNVNTDGYTRQQAMMATVGGVKDDNLDPGAGVKVSNIRRVTDQFLVKQMWSTKSSSSYASHYTTNMSQMENTLGADGFSISAGLDSLYAALHDATSKPESVPLRQQIRNESEAIARRFNTLTQALYSQHKDMHDQRNAAVANANTLLINIADVNKQIAETSGTGGNPAQLLDKRDNLIHQLSELVEIKTSDQHDGTTQVTLVSGQPLVIGGEYGTLRAVPSDDDSYLAQMEVDFDKQTFAVPNALGGGLGAINDYQNEVLKPYMNALDDMAAGLADMFNGELAKGLDLNRQKGKPLFKYDPAHPSESLDITDITPEQLALSGDGNPGNSDVLAKLITLSNRPVGVGRFGNMSLNDAFTAIVGETAIRGRQAESDYQAKNAMDEQAVAARDNTSAVNSDEEAANLMTFSKAHDANMKVISTANRLFDTVLQLF